MQLNGAHVVLTGASGGLGIALAHALHAEGAQLLLCGRDAGRLGALRTSLGANAQVLLADLTQPADIERVATEAANFGADLLINNAGISGYGLLAQQPWAVIDAVLQINLIAPIRLTHTMLPHLVRKPAAAVVMVGSIFGSLPFAGFAAYSSAKAGLRGFSQALRRELADTPVEVFYFAPRAIDTALNSPAARRLNATLGNTQDAPEQVARRIVQSLHGTRYEHHLGFPERLFSWINGLNPRWIDRGVAAKLSAIKRIASEERA
ncbi:MAG: SDR family oxidoreductase [Proteobacteria bacterium]|nr:SDR family oxidoreductase [Pseudomonadota bacterium]